MFDFVISGRITWQEERIASDALHQRRNGFGGMKGCVIKNDDIAGCKLRDERCLHPLQKEIAVAVAVEYDGRKERIVFESGDQIDALARRAISRFVS